MTIFFKSMYAQQVKLLKVIISKFFPLLEVYCGVTT